MQQAESEGAFAPGVQEGAFAPGTRITTLSASGVMGETVVESLQPGDTVLTLLGPEERATPIRAVRRVEAAGLAVRIRAGALAPAMPAADLVVPATALLRLRDSLPADVPIGAGEDPGQFVPAAALLNSTSVLRDTAPEEWVVVDLGESSVLLANATATASAVSYPRPLPVMPAGVALNQHRQRIASRAAALAPLAAPPPPPPSPAAEPEPAPITVLAAGKPVVLHEEAPLRFLAELPARSGPVRLRSRPRKAADEADGRRFGVCVSSVVLNDVVLDFASQSFGPGFHPAEGEGDHLWRWTNGDAWLVLPYSADPRRLTLVLTDWHSGLALA